MKRNILKDPALRPLLKPYWGRIFFLCLLTVLLSVLQVAMALLFRFVIDGALEGGEGLTLWGGLLIADILATVGVYALLVWCNGATEDRMIAEMRQRILRTAVYSRDEKLLDHHSGELMNRAMEDVNTLCEGAVTELPVLVGQLTRLVAAFAAVWVISVPVALALLVVAVVVLCGAAILRPMLKKRQRKVRESDEQLMASMQEDLQQLELIQSLEAQEQTLDCFSQKIKKNLRTRALRRLVSVGSGSAISLGSQLSVGVLLLWGAARVADQALSYGSLTAMLQLLGQFRAPVLGISGTWSRFAAIEVAGERLTELLQPAEPAKKQPVEKVGAIVFEGVTFSYPGDEVPVLEQFDFRFPLDGWTCLTGISGKGKTTIFKLILGLYAPQSGRIYLETPEGQIPCNENTRHLFAYVPQDYALFSGTVLENFQLIDPDITEETLRQVLHIAQADFVWDMTDREQTQVRENNAGLSKGQLQRLAIARAVLMDRPIFLLDECTSALDAQTEEAVLQCLRQLGKQAILVTHRPDAVRSLENTQFVSMEQ